MATDISLNWLRRTSKVDCISHWYGQHTLQWSACWQGWLSQLWAIQVPGPAVSTPSGLHLPPISQFPLQRPTVSPVPSPPAFCELFLWLAPIASSAPPSLLSLVWVPLVAPNIAASLRAPWLPGRSAISTLPSPQVAWASCICPSLLSGKGVPDAHPLASWAWSQVWLLIHWVRHTFSSWLCRNSSSTSIISARSGCMFCSFLFSVLRA